MAITTFKATTRRKKGLAVTAEARGFNVDIDEPESLGGSNTGMNPVELVLCALGGCQTILASSFAEKMKINLEDFWIELEGELDPDGFMGLSDVRPGYQSVRYNMHIKSDASEEKIRKFIELIEKRCPVGDTIGNVVKLEKAKITIEK
ncbi:MULTISPECIES: OsmC family protein [Clostridium]|uniref:OsmC-like protein n=3 Tax=Clostridium TaxID=1485 RepID=D8GIH5_CLOLD|nr:MULTISPECIES: OsmC family protein [Clostridium]ADK17049.1 predicted OsmC-like protein [Clostridium ljungdahlii DSM 13528]AGY76090.1 OsmC family protein [Clostridium autoethanogenum DSM 10061]ALU36252.1 OsmC family protein [Clostridium autoethanogenum DSM 10061]OAA85185.1 OsmC-like protein [Clostridium ljungdahlii DSM 13528]OVY48813.1 OsmC-like protein [Clostridium autoethanogenum]